MYNPNLDITQMPNDSSVFGNGISKIQLVFLWQGKPPFASHVHDVVKGPLADCTQINMLKGLMDGHGTAQARQSKKAASMHAQGFYTSMAGFVLRTPSETYTYVRPHIEAEMAESQRAKG